MGVEAKMNALKRFKCMTLNKTCGFTKPDFLTQSNGLLLPQPLERSLSSGWNVGLFTVMIQSWMNGVIQMLAMVDLIVVELLCVVACCTSPVESTMTVAKRAMTS